jgi:hypothetical protein
MTDEYETLKSGLLSELMELMADTTALEEIEHLAERMAKAYITRISAEKQKEE